MAQALEGYAAIFYRAGDSGSEYRLAKDIVERVMPTAFDKVLASSIDVAAFWNHNADFLLGSRSAGTLRISKDAKGLRYSIDYNEADPQHVSIRAKILRGDVPGSSFSFAIRDEQTRREGSGFVRELHDVMLYEVSPVWRPAYASTSAAARSLCTPGSVRWCQENPAAAKRLERVRQIESEMRQDRLRYIEAEMVKDRLRELAHG